MKTLNWKGIKNKFPVAFEYFDSRLSSQTDIETKERFYALNKCFVSSILTTVFKVLDKRNINNATLSIWSIPFHFENELEVKPQTNAEEELFFRVFQLLEHQLRNGKRYLKNLQCPYEVVNYPISTR